MRRLGCGCGSPMPGRPRLANAVIGNPAQARRSPRLFAVAGPAGVCAVNAGRKPAKPAFSAPAPRQKRRRSLSKRFSRGSGTRRPCRSQRQTAPAPASLGGKSASAARSKRRRTRMPTRHQDHSRQSASAGCGRRARAPGSALAPKRLREKRLRRFSAACWSGGRSEQEAPCEEGETPHPAVHERMTCG